MATEQVSAERLVGRAWEDFDFRLLSIGSLYLVWGALSTPEELAKRYLLTRGGGHLLDKRRHLGEAEKEKAAEILFRAEAAIRYRDWARENKGQPILQDAVVAYCAAFEAALKSIAVAFELAKFVRGSSLQVFVEERELKRAVGCVESAWKGSGRRGASNSSARSK